MTSMSFQFSILGLLRATVWFAIACLILRLVFVELGFELEHIADLTVGLLMILAPFAVIGALFERMGVGILCGLATILAFALFHLGAR
jgi:hypothetical protein